MSVFGKSAGMYLIEGANGMVFRHQVGSKLVEQLVFDEAWVTVTQISVIDAVKKVVREHLADLHSKRVHF